MSKIIESIQEYGEALSTATQFANQNTDGQFSLLKSGNHWRVSFSPVRNQQDIDQMMVGDRVLSVVKSAIDRYSQKSGKNTQTRTEARA